MADLSSTANQLDELEPRFRDIRRLGEGAEGGTYTALDRETGRKVVLKPLRRGDPAGLRAIRVLQRVGSPHLPAIVDVHRGSSATWLATAWIDGAPLAPEPTDPPTALGEALGVAHALAEIHGAGTHHGDVSPGNVVVTPTHGVVLVDLGQVGTRGVGTPGFLAPEVLGGGGGPAADWFSLGCILCCRLFGEPPWRRPEALVAVRGRADVRRRLSELSGGGSVAPEVLELLERLLHPDPASRPARGEGVVQRLAQLRAAASSGAGLRPRPAWWIPARWPFRGDLSDVERRLAGPTAPRLVAVAGPRGSGRARVVEEIVLALAAAGTDARVVDVEGVRRRGSGSARTWIDGWASAVERDVVLGLTEVPRALQEPWGGAALMSALETAHVPLVVPVGPELGDALDGRAGVQVLRVRPWTRDELARVVRDVHDGDARAWADALLAATGGWPGRAIRALEAAAAAGLERPDPVALGKELDRGDAARLRPEMSAAVLLAAWGDPDAAATLPPHLHDAGRPLSWAVSEAHRCLGQGAIALARELVEQQGEGASVWALLDARHWDAVDRSVREGRVDLHRDPVVPWLLAAVREGSEATVGAGARAILADHLLATADAGGALDLVAGVGGDPACSLQAARALQRLGRPEEARSRLEALLETPDAAISQRARGLRWRVLLDLGRGEEVVREARAWSEPGPTGDAAGLAEAYLWAAYAGLVAGAEEDAERWLEAATQHADACLEGAPGVAARVRQVRANLAHAGGDLARASEEYRLAAAAFARAGEAVGELGVQASLANLAVLTGDTATGVRDGRAALRGLLSRGEVQRLPETATALVQLLARAGRLEEAESTVAATSASVTDSGAVAAARVARMTADVLAARVPRGEVERTEAAAAFSGAADRLEAAGAHREAADAHLRAAELLRLAGIPTAAAASLGAARPLVDGDDRDATLRAELEALAQATAAGDLTAVDAGLRRVLTISDPDELSRQGQLDLLLALDRALLPALQLRLRDGHPARQQVAVRLRNNLENLMSKTSSIDTAAARSALTAEGQDPDSLRSILDELDGSVPARRQQVKRGDDGGQLARLLRMYRRLAREEDLGRVLEQVVDAMMDLTDAERGAVVVRPVDGQPLEVTRELAAGSDGFRFSRSVIERVFGSGEPVLSVDAAEDDRFDESRSISHLNLRSVLAVPLTFRGQVLGAAYVDHRLRRGNFDEGDLAHMEEFADLAALAVAHAQALDSVRRQSAALEESQAELTRALEQRDAEVIGLREEVRSGGPLREEYRGMVGSTEAMQRIFRLIDRVADADAPVVIHGESGTGKELVARAIHAAGSRASGPFVAENCGAIPETLLEGVLFGHARGAFTGADRARVGLFEAADGGTIFLDEVSEMSPAMQTKLLRVLQEGEVRRVGENGPRKVDVRVIAASNRDLEALVESGDFRQDLYYRINVVQLRLPPLRERKEDLPALVSHFVERYGAGRELSVSSSTLRILSGYDWPGNVRELENEVRRWVALAGDRVGPDDLSPAILGAGEDAPDPDDIRLKPRMERLERQLIERALERTDGNQTRAAELLGVSRYGLQKKLRRLAGDDAQ